MEKETLNDDVQNAHQNHKNIFLSVFIGVKLLTVYSGFKVIVFIKIGFIENIFWGVVESDG